MVLAQYEKQTASSKIWTRIAESISIDNIFSTTRATI